MKNLLTLAEVKENGGCLAYLSNNNVTEVNFSVIYVDGKETEMFTISKNEESWKEVDESYIVSLLTRAETIEF